ncbi:NADH-cytochrome b5 reductase [Agyrium rufum]|nr:NADH-cytochrome b5 reductase [Agyrium rufum]
MISRHLFRCAQQPLKQGVRRYATEPPKSSNNATLIGGIVAAGALGTGYYLTTGEKSSQKIATKASDLASTAAKEVKSDDPISANVKASKSAFTGGDQGWIDLKLESVEEINHNTKKFRFALPEKDQTSGLTVASALLTQYKGPEMEKPAIRPYTPVSDEDQVGTIDFIIKKYPNGAMSEHMHDMEPPQRLNFKGPIPKYPYKPNEHKHVAMIAGGTGITPMYQVARAIFKNPEDKTKVTLVFGNLTEEDILLKREFEELENTYPQRFRAFYVLDNPPERWMQPKGHVTKELLKTVLPEAKEEGTKIFVCGPPGMYKAVSGAKKSPSDQGELAGMLKDLGYTKDQVYKF